MDIGQLPNIEKKTIYVNVAIKKNMKLNIYKLILLFKGLLKKYWVLLVFWVDHANCSLKFL